jgi:hypothetical protein
MSNDFHFSGQINNDIRRNASQQVQSGKSTSYIAAELLRLRAVDGPGLNDAEARNQQSCGSQAFTKQNSPNQRHSFTGLFNSEFHQLKHKSVNVEQRPQITSTGRPSDQVDSSFGLGRQAKPCR